MECSYAPFLPPEIWQKIFQGFHQKEELAHLWTWGRLVSWQLRNIIEFVFATTWLKETEIVFNLGLNSVMFLSPEYEEYSLERMERISLTRISFSFKCFVADQYSEKAIWKLDEDRYKQRLLIRHKMSDDMLRQDRVIRPAHYILLRREVNDTELLGFEWDPEQLEVRIDWKGMYNGFFGEKDPYDRDSSNVRHDISLQLKRRLDAGAIDQNEFTKKSFTMLENATDGSYKRIRRRRLDRQFNRLQVKDGGKGMAGFEKSAMHRLKGIRFGLNFVNDSDDETEQ